MQVKTPERAQNVCTRLMRPTRADSQALAKIFPKAPNVNIRPEATPTSIRPHSRVHGTGTKEEEESCYALLTQTQASYH